MRYLSNVTGLEYNPEKCTGCGRCLEVCPHGVFQAVADEKKVTVIDRDACMECGACVSNCAFGALRVDAGVGCAQALINAMVTGGEPYCGCSTDGDGNGGGGCC